MALTTELWEDSGPIDSQSGLPTTRIEVDNLGWKDSGADETTPYVDYPLVRPYGSSIYTVSFVKYYYFKVYGTYDHVENLTVQFNGTPVGNGAGSGTASKVRMYYKWTSNYAEPTADLLSGSWFDPANPPVWTPLLSTTGPGSGASWTPTLTNDQTYYTQYLVTQLYVEPSTWDDFGNLNTSFELAIDYDERKTGLPQYDSSLVNWSW